MKQETKTTAATRRSVVLHRMVAKALKTAAATEGVTINAKLHAILCPALGLGSIASKPPTMASTRPDESYDTITRKVTPKSPSGRPR
jgi:hypothetical protein